MVFARRRGRPTARASPPRSANCATRSPCLRRSGGRCGARGEAARGDVARGEAARGRGGTGWNRRPCARGAARRGRDARGAQRPIICCGRRRCEELGPIATGAAARADFGIGGRRNVSRLALPRRRGEGVATPSRACCPRARAEPAAHAPAGTRGSASRSRAPRRRRRAGGAQPAGRSAAAPAAAGGAGAPYEREAEAVEGLLVMGEEQSKVRRRHAAAAVRAEE